MAKLSTDVNRPYLPEQGATVSAEIEVEAPPQEDPVDRHVALCIDASGSMSGAKIQRARDGAEWVFGLLSPDDYVSVVAFDDGPEILLPATRWGDIDRSEAAARIDRLTAGGGTDMYSGLDAARDSLAELPMAASTVRRILLLSDGKDNHRGPSEFEVLARDIDADGIRIKSAGIGSDYNEHTIRTLGTTARGEWTHLSAAGDIEQFFGEAVEQAGTVVAPDATLALDVAPGVEVSDVYRARPQTQEVDPDWQDNSAVIQLPDLLDRQTQKVVLKLQAPPRAVGESVTLADVTLSARGETARGAITVEYSDDPTELAEDREDVSMAHRETVIKTELGKGNVETAETQLETMAAVHGEQTQVVQEMERETQLVKEGGREEQSRATKVVTDEGVQQ
ncbi:MAG: VWA domain-containing protein [Haloarculaceae archaeon]